MKVVQVNVDYTEEVNSSNKNWLNSDSRHCDILVRSDDAETIKYSGTLSQSQVEHIVFLIQDNYSAKDIKDQIIEYGVQNLSPTVTPQIGDPEFLEELSICPRDGTGRHAALRKRSEVIVGCRFKSCRGHSNSFLSWRHFLFYRYV